MYFNFFAVLMFAVSFIFMIAAIKYKVRDYVGAAEALPSGDIALGQA
jgi:hypothetical protein